jgi:uncharacterized protein (DUF885 family)
MAKDYWNLVLKASPLRASYLGDRSRDGELPDLSPTTRRAFRENLRGIRQRLTRVDIDVLPAQAWLTATVLRSRLEAQLLDEVCQGWTWVVDQLGGPQVSLAEIPSYHVVDGEQRARNLIARYRGFPDYFRQHQTNLETGLSQGRTAARINVERVLGQLKSQLALPVAELPYVARIRRVMAERDLPEPYPGFDAALLEAVEDHVAPALRGYQAFLQTRVLPRARTVVGISYLPDGAACYRSQIRRHTGLALTADEIHEIGLAEVDRIRREMETLAAEMGGAELESFMADLSERPEQRGKSSEALLAYNRDLVKRATAALPRAFVRLPGGKVEVKPIEAFRAADAPAAYYYRAPEDGSRSAIYFLNTHAPESRLLYKMPALAFHEAVPGHHLQIALAAERRELPEFMRHGGSTAFTEGWALYAESLAGELGLYQTREEQLGALSYEIWRAARLVVDTGLHAMDWSRDQAIDYLAFQTGHDHGEVVNEIDRYITWPGQALAYKLGQLKISDLRRRAEGLLGDGFDLRAFHDRVLRNGSIPLDVLEAQIVRWLGD